ncbi:MAG: MATE family efflux transporter [Microcoleaceae cyanobacterium]
MNYSVARSRFVNWLKSFTLYQEIYEEAKACLTLATPLSLAQLIEVSMITVDTWTMGALGAQALAGGALGYITFRFLTAMGFRTLSAVNTVAAISFGAKQTSRLGEIVTQGFYLALLLAFPVIAIFVTAGIWMGFLGQEPINVQLSQAYLQAIWWGLPALFAYEVLRNVLSAVGRPGIITAIAAGSIFLNAGANYVLAFGKFGFPTLGLAGIGYATAIVVWVQLLAALLYVGLNPDIKQNNILQWPNSFKFKTLSEIFEIGWTNGVYYISGGGYQVVLVYLFGCFGSVPLAAFQIANQVCLLIRDMIWGLAQAIISRVGQMYGQQNSMGIRRAGFVGIALGALIALIYLSIVAIAKEQVVGIFLTPETELDREVFHLATQFLIIVSLLQVCNEIETTSLAALRGIKDTRFPLFFGLVSYWGIGLGGAYLLAFHWQLEGMGLIIGYYLALVATSIFLPIRFYMQSGNLTFESGSGPVPMPEEMEPGLDKIPASPQQPS